MKRRKLIPDPVLMVISILGIAAFLFYWLKQSYDREEKSLAIKTEMLFRETVMKLQVSKLKLDGVMIDSTGKGGLKIFIAKMIKERSASGPKKKSFLPSM